jgi:hypothetical protein
MVTVSDRRNTHSDPELSPMRWLAVAWLSVLCLFDGIGVAEPQSGQALTLGSLNEMVRTKLPRGLGRSEAEKILQSWGTWPKYIPREEFALNSLTTIIVAPPPESVGALVTVTGHLEERWLYDPFAAIVVHIGSDDRVIIAGYMVLGDGP